MKKRNDSGYPVNVRNFKTLIDVIISFGAAYNPVKFSIILENLKALFDKIMLSLKAVDEAARDMSTAYAGADGSAHMGIPLPYIPVGVPAVGILYQFG
ncbi:MAG: hypothetical protein HYZ51_03340, partial [Candidatus Doudnabacteria bacterium]|nr:hypothetical protein [Candidatus Doudnabacteria bacterium]